MMMKINKKRYKEDVKKMSLARAKAIAKRQLVKSQIYKNATSSIQSEKIFIKKGKYENFTNESKSILYCTLIFITTGCGKHCGNRLKVWKTSI